MRITPVLALVLGLIGAPPPATAQESADAPRRLGLIEEAGVTLLLLDVEAVDGEGRPLPGLTRDDFVVSLSGRRWKIYSADDLCPCSPGQPGASLPAPRAGEALQPAPGSAPALKPSTSLELPPRGEPVSFIIYLDFAQLRMGGRLRAVRNATHWVRETRRPGEAAMIVAYSSATGMRRLTPLTTSTEKLTVALESASTDHRFIDSFPEGLETRIDECKASPQLCRSLAFEEYFHGRSSLRALKRLMTLVEEFPGRKAVLYFHENGMMMPGAVYGTKVVNHLDLARDLGAAANQALASVYTVNVGTLPDLGARPVWGELENQALTLGLNLSDHTGGRHNHGAVDMAGFLEGTERSCRCIYRLGLVPPGKPPDRTYTATVTAAGHLSPARYAVRFLSEEERWMRRARLVLEDPAEAVDIPITSAIVPLRASERRWDIAVRIALSTSSLTLLPGGGRLGGEWETGALLSDERGGNVHEMLGVYHVRQSGETGSIVLHEHLLEGMKPGTYLLRAFVRDRSASLFGGTEAAITLPHPAKGGVIGPIWMSGPLDRLLAPLPLLTRDGSRAPGPATKGRGLVPAGDRPLLGEQSLEAQSWFCPAGDAARGPGLRFIARGAQPILRFDVGAVVAAGTCSMLSDRLGAGDLPPGSYVYHLTASQFGGAIDQESPFGVTAPR